MDSIPQVEAKGGRLKPIVGQPPNLAAIPSGCPFHPRCPLARTGAAAAPGSRLRHRPAAAAHGHARPRGGLPLQPRRSSMPEAPLTVQAGGTSRPGWDRRRRRCSRSSACRSYFPLTQGIVFKKTVGHVRAVDGVDLILRRGETVGMVGESGCGKSTVAKLLVALEKPTGGTIRYKGEDVAKMGGRALKRYRREVQIIFQDPYGSLNPRMTVGDIVAEGWSVHADIAPTQGPAAAHPGAAGARRPQPRLRQPLPAPVLRRPAPAHRHRPRARAAAGGHRLRRAGVGARRVGAGPGGQPARGPAGRLRHVLPLHRPRPVGRAPPLRPDRGHVPGQRRRGGHRGAGVRLAVAPLHPGAAVVGAAARAARCAGRRTGSCCRATCPARPTRRRAAGSAPGAGRRRTSAPSRRPALVDRGQGHPAACHFAEAREVVPVEVD